MSYKRCVVVVSTLLLLGLSVSVDAFGSNLIHSAGKQRQLPVNVTAAMADGWTRSSTPCDPMIGQAFNKKGNSPSESNPITLYFAANGQLSGFGTDAFGDLPVNLVAHGYWMPVAHGQYRIQVATRAVGANETSLCSVSTPFKDVIGDRIIINPSKLNQRVPATEKDATAQRWTRGACINGMGRHWEYDLATAPVQSWNVSNLLPVVPMYDNSGNLNAVFFASPVVQQSLFSNNMWDVIPIPGALMCKNFLPPCGWPTFTPWSTMHMWFGTTQITCNSP